MAAPIVYALVTIARLAGFRDLDGLVAFCKNLNDGELLRLREMAEQLAAVARPTPLYTDPKDFAQDEFSKLVWKIEATLNPNVARQVFESWTATLASKRDKKSGVLIRLLTMEPEPNVSKLARQMAKENEEAVPPGERKGWTSSDPEILKRMIFDVQREFREHQGDEGV